MRLDVFVYQGAPADVKLDQIITLLQAIQIKEEQMDADIQAIIDQATKNEDAETAAQTALVALFAKLQAAIAATASLSAADRATLQAKVAEMTASAAAVSAAIVANTPAA
jgi:hypothetical protein